MSLTGSKSTPVNEDGLTILKSTYGVDTQSVDVTTEVKGHPKLEKFKTGDQVAISVPNVKRPKTNHSFSLMTYIFGASVIFLWGLFIIDGYKTGLYVFGKDEISKETGQMVKTGSGGIIIAILILIFGLANFGVLPWFITLIVVCCYGFARRQR